MISVNFNNGCTEIQNTYGLWQYDYGQKLRIQGLDLPAAVEIHFSLNDTRGESVTRVGTTRDRVTDVTIPDSMLENNDIAKNYPLYVFIYLTDEESGQTEYKITMLVRSRPRPEAFDTPEDAELFREAIAAVNEAADRAEAAKDNAKASEEKAGEYLGATENLSEQVAADKNTVANLAREVQENKNTVVQLAGETKTNANQVAVDTANTERLAAEVSDHAKRVASDKEMTTELVEQVKTNAISAKNSADQAASNAQVVLEKAKQVENSTNKVEELVKKVEEKPDGGVSSWNDLTDKPFYEEVKKTYTEVFPVKQYDFSNYDTESESFALIFGKTYKVDWNGTEYNCVAKKVLGEEFSTQGIHAVYLGNCNLINTNIEVREDELEFPFVIFNMVADSNGAIVDACIRANGEVGIVTVSFGFETLTSVIHYLDPRFIKGMYYEEGGNAKEIFPLTKGVTEDQMTENDTLLYDPSASMFIIMPSVVLDLVEGETYVVSLNGDKYPCRATSVELEPGSGVYAIALGDVYTMSDGQEGTESTGEPFAIVAVPPEMSEDFGASASGILLMERPEELTLGIFGDSKIHQIHPKYIPEMYYTEEAKEAEVFAETLITIGTAGVTSISDTTIEDKVAAGDIVAVYFDGTRYEHIIPERTLDGYVIVNGGRYIMSIHSSGVDLASTSGAHTVAINLVSGEGVVHTIPKKYLPGYKLFDLTSLGTVTDMVGDTGELAKAFYDYVKEHKKARVRINISINNNPTDYERELVFGNGMDVDGSDQYESTFVRYSASRLLDMYCVMLSFDGESYLLAIAAGQVSG